MDNLLNNSFDIKLQKNDVIEVDIDDNGLEGDGVAHYNGAAVFIKGAIKGERVRAKIILVKNKIAFGIIEKIIRTSFGRSNPPCPVYSKCGGCSLQHIDYAAQLDIKTESLKTTLKKQGIDVSAVQPCAASDKRFNYRNKLSLPVRGDPPKIGFFAKNSHRVVEISDCLLQDFDCCKLIDLFKAFFADFNLSGYDDETGKGDVRHIVARHLDGLYVLTLVVNKPLKQALKALNERLNKLYGENYVLYSNLNTKNNNVIFSESFELIGGNTRQINFCGAKITVHPAAFFQVNNYIASKIYGGVLAHIESFESNKDSRIIIDAYAGAGLMSYSFCSLAKTVYSVEINKEAHAAAERLKNDNNAENLECLLGDCAEIVPEIAAKENGKNIIAVLDPPRNGADEKVLLSLINSSVSDIIYISCNPATLARDLKVLNARYEIVSIRPYDMFPQTGALETLVCLSRKTPGSHIKI